MILIVFLATAGLFLVTYILTFDRPRHNPSTITSAQYNAAMQAIVRQSVPTTHNHKDGLTDE